MKYSPKFFKDKIPERKRVKTITHIFIPLFIGLIIGGAVAGNKSAWIIGLILLVVDILVGISLQYLLDRQISNAKPFKSDEWNSLTFEEKLKSVEGSIEKEKQNMRDKGIDVDDELKKYYDELRSKTSENRNSDTQSNNEK